MLQKTRIVTIILAAAIAALRAQVAPVVRDRYLATDLEAARLQCSDTGCDGQGKKPTKA